MPEPGFGLFLLVLDWLIRLGLSARILARRLPVGTTYAWLIVVLAVPIGGAVAYMMFGELRLGSRRMKLWQQLKQPYDQWLQAMTRRFPDPLATLDSDDERGFARLALRTFDSPPVPGNEITLLRDAAESIRALIADIDAAERTCHLEFYIWSDGGIADDLGRALVRAAARGVTCRVLVDALGSAQFLKGSMIRELRAGGVAVREALPVSIWRLTVARLDLRNHRKIAVIDGEIGYTGSLNIADPRYFKQSAGVGQWIDAMARLRGPAVESLAITFLEDWELEAREGFDQLAPTSDVHELPEAGPATVQLLASGPQMPHQEIREVLLCAILMAREEVILTTPYFVPDELLLAAVASAARRGVNVTLVLPEKVDSRLVQLVSESYFAALSRAGVRIMLFRGGLLHTKSITVDRDFCLFGSLNLDLRSLTLNFEATLAVYDDGFTCAVRDLQRHYLQNSIPVAAEKLRLSTFREQLAERVAYLVSPLL